MLSPLLSTTYTYDRQQVIYIFDKMCVKVNTQGHVSKLKYTETAAHKIVID